MDHLAASDNLASITTENELGMTPLEYPSFVLKSLF